jgi:hypothetical protein
MIKVFENPFAILGVPQELLDAEVMADNPKMIIELVEGSYKYLSKLYHPDRGGDHEVFVRIAMARDEILDDPMTVARFFSRHRDKEAKLRRDMLKQADELKAKEKSALFKLLANIDPTRVAPWLSKREALVGNTIFGVSGKSLLLIATLSDRYINVSIAANDYDGRRFAFSKIHDSWKVSKTDPITDRPAGFELVKPHKLQQLILVGGMREHDANRISFDDLASDTSSLDLSLRDQRFALESSGAPGQLSWTPVSQCKWINSIKPHTKHDDYLVIMSSESSDNEPKLSIIGPVFRTRNAP